MTTIYERLKVDHDKQRALCAKILETQGDSEERQALWHDLFVELEAHALAEEQTFYSALMEKPDGTEKARHSVHEHKEMADCAEELHDMSMDQGAWLNKFKKLEHLVTHHVDEEEEEIFVRAKKVLSDEEATKLAADFNERKEAELADAEAEEAA